MGWLFYIRLIDLQIVLILPDKQTAVISFQGEKEKENLKDHSGFIYQCE